jgi:hypothetical protein
MNGRSHKRSKTRFVWRGTDDGSRTTSGERIDRYGRNKCRPMGNFGSREVAREVPVVISASGFIRLK